MAYTSTMRIAGLNSGLDTETMITQLMNAESMKLNSYKRKLTTLTWKQEAYRSVYTDLKSFQSNYLDILSPTSLRASGTFKKFTSTVKNSAGVNSTALKADASSDAGMGTYKVKVQQLAQTDVYESDSKISGIRGSSDFNAANVIAGDTYNITLDGVSRRISFSEEDIATIGGDNQSFVEVFNSKLEAAFGTETVNVAANQADVAADTSGETELGDMVPKTSAKIFAALDGGRLTINTSEYSSHTASIADGDYREDDKSPLAEGLGIASGSSTTLNTGASLEELFGENLGTFTITMANGSYSTFNTAEYGTLDKLMEAVNNSGLGVTLSYSSSSQSFKLESNDTGAANGIARITSETDTGNFLTEKLGLKSTQEAQDSIATINGQTFVRESNDYSEFGVKWSLTEETGDETLTVTIGRDTEAIFNNIKSFVDAYNEIIDTLNGYANTRRPKSNGSYYDPLLDEEKTEMTEKQIADWEEKAKTGILYRDSILTGISSQMRNALYQPVQMEDGSSLGLYQIGITTGAWKENGKLVIDEEKLRAAIEENGDNVAAVFNKKGSGLADKLDKIVETAVSSHGTIANKAGIVDSYTESNNEMYRQIRSQNEKINSLLTKLANKETYYYNMFAKLEAAIAQSDSQSSYISSVFGS